MGKEEGKRTTRHNSGPDRARPCPAESVEKSNGDLESYIGLGLDSWQRATPGDEKKGMSMTSKKEGRQGPIRPKTERPKNPGS